MDPIDLDAIEAAVAFGKECRKDTLQLIHAVRERDAEIAQLLEAIQKARESAIEEAASAMPKYRFSDCPEMQTIAAHVCVVLRQHIRALAAEPVRYAKPRTNP